MEEKQLELLIRILTKMLTDTNAEGQSKAIIFAIQTYDLSKKKPAEVSPFLADQEKKLFPAAAEFAANKNKQEGVDMDAINKSIDEKFKPILEELKRMNVSAEAAANLKKGV